MRYWPLSDYADIKGGKRLPKGKNLTTTPTPHPYIRVRDLGSEKVLEVSPAYEYVDSETQKTIFRYIVEKGDVIISIVGTIGRAAIIGETLNGANLTENCAKIVNISGLDKHFLYYYLISEEGQNAISAATVGAVQAKLPLKNIEAIPIPNYTLDDQRAIADTLSALDDKIANNKKINHHLEQMAQAIFKSWFVDFEPFGGTMPDEWREGTLGQFVSIKRGGSPRPIQDFLSDTGLRWLKISDVTALQTPYVLEIKEHIRETGLRKTVFLKSGALVLSNSATPGIPKILGVDTCIHDGWLYFPSSLFSNEYLYLFFNHIRQNLVALGNGSVFTNLKTDILKSYAVSVPNDQTLQKFDDLIAPLFREMESCTRESLKLNTLRNALLPRLMSGELSVADIKIEDRAQDMQP